MTLDYLATYDPRQVVMEDVLASMHGDLQIIINVVFSSKLVAKAYQYIRTDLKD